MGLCKFYPYTYVLNNPLKYTDPSGYRYYWKRFQWENSVTEAIRSSGGGGFGYPNLTQARSYQNWCVRNLGFNPFWSYSENTGTYNNRETGGRVNAGDANALDRIGADYTSLSSKAEAYEALGYARKVLGTDGIGNQEVLYTDPMGKLSVKNEPFWEITGSYYNPDYFLSGVEAYGDMKFVIGLIAGKLDYSALIPAAYSLELNSSSEGYIASNLSLIGGIAVLRGPDRGKIKGFTSAGIGGGAIGVSGHAVKMRYHYFGDINHFSIQNTFRGGSVDVDFTAGFVGLSGGAYVTIMLNNDPEYAGDFLIGMGSGFGFGTPGLSGSITWNYTEMF